MRQLALQRQSAWTEDKATLRSDLSADPGAKTDGAARGRPVSTHRDWHQSAKPSRHDAATAPARCPSPLANAKRRSFQFPLNQDTTKTIIEGFKKAINALTVQDKGNAEIRDYIKLRHTRPFVAKDQSFLIPRRLGGCQRSS